MKGLLGAATVMGALMYGAGHVWEGHANFYLHEHDLARAPTDEEFIHMEHHGIDPNTLNSGHYDS